LHLLCETQYHNLEVITKLLEHGLDINEQDNRLRTALHVATIKGDAVMVSILLRLGASTNFVDRDGYSALSYAMYQIILTSKPVDYCVLRLLLRYGAQLSGEDLEVRTIDFKSIANNCVYLIDCRKKARIAVIVFIGIKRFNRSQNMKSNNIDAIKLIGQMIWNKCIDTQNSEYSFHL
jgi:ankyrin repeat protein